MYNGMEIKIFNSVFDIPAVQWRRLEDPDYPFTDYSFFAALERGGCLGPTAGWQPIYLSLWEQDELLGISYLFEKNHSYGEYIFDWEWASAYARCGLQYYPKLTSMVPFTPATGPSFLLRSDVNVKQLQASLLNIALKLAAERKMSGLHYLFIHPEEIASFRDAGLLIRKSFQFHWTNQGYRDFEEYLNSLKRKRRQQIQKERREVAKLPISIHLLRGGEIQAEHIDAIYRFYQSTIQDKAAYPYLSRGFFDELRASMAAQLVLCLAKEGERWVAGSINFQKGKKLYGRYWGCDQYYPYLHFELCYYQTIEFAIQQGLDSFEAGAQGEHKELRGLVPEATYSAHWLRDDEFRKAIGRFIQEEEAMLDKTWLSVEKSSPYRNKKVAAVNGVMGKR